MAKTTKRDTKGRFTSHALYFSGWGYDERQDITLRYRGEDVRVVEVAGQPLRLRMDGYLYFRHLNDDDERASLIMLKNVLHGFAADINQIIPERFAQYYTAQEYGRCLLYVSDYMRPDQCLFLCFAPEGSGFCRETDYLRRDFRWQEATPLQWQEILTADPEDIKPLCTRIFEEQVHPLMTNKFLALIGVSPADCVDEPHQFLCGSEAELRRITTYIVQTQAELFDRNMEPVTITYWALTLLNRTDRMRVERGWNRQLAQGRILALCNLALQYNAFVGVKWWPPHHPNPTRIAEMQAEAWKIKTIVHPPSAHERAEALLALAGWLDGKVSEQEKRELLQLAGDVEV